MKQYYIDNFEITDYVGSKYETSEMRSIAGEDLIRISNFNINMWNGDGFFSFSNPTSIFYGRNESESIFEIIEDGNQLYKGRVSNATLNADKSTCQINVISLIDDIMNRTCVYLKQSITPAQAFYEILVLNGMADYIEPHSYLEAKNHQESIGLYVDLDYYIDSTATVSSVLQILASMSSCDVFFSNGLIYFQQWFDSENPNTDNIIPTEFILGPVQFYNDPDNIRNQYVYNITLGSANFPITDYEIGTDSRKQWGERSYNAIDLTDGSDISSIAITGLNDAGTDRILRAQNPQRYCKFTVLTEDYTYTFTLETIFKFDDLLSELLASDLQNIAWRVLELKKSDTKIEITGVLL